MTFSYILSVSLLPSIKGDTLQSLSRWLQQNCNCNNFTNTRIQHIFRCGHSNNTFHLLRASNWTLPFFVAVFELRCTTCATVTLAMCKVCRDLRHVHLVWNGPLQSLQQSARCVELPVWFRWWIRPPWDSELPRELTNHPWSEFPSSQHFPSPASNG